jgi:hypothetical protein
MNVRQLLNRILNNPDLNARDLTQHLDSNGNYHYPEDLTFQNGIIKDKDGNVITLKIQSGHFLERLGELMFLIDSQKRYTVYQGKFDSKEKIIMNDVFLNTGINRGSGGGCIDIIVESPTTR